MARKQARDAAMQLVYEWTVGGSGDQTFEELLEGDRFEETDRAFVFSLVTGVKERAEELDEIISRYSIDWKVSRMARIDLAILRTAVYEIISDPSVAPGVVIKEAVRLAKKYSSDKSISFINGLLGNYAKSLGEERNA